MRRRHTPARDLGSLAGGRALQGDAAGELDLRIARLLRAAFPEAPVPVALEEAHLAAILASTQSVAVEGAVAATLPSSPRRSRRYRVPRLAARLAIASAAFLLLFSGLALAGTLPAPLQGFASDAAALIGVHVPPPHGSPPERFAEPSPSARPSATAVPSASPANRADADRSVRRSPVHQRGRAHSGLRGQRGQGRKRGEAHSAQQRQSQSRKRSNGAQSQDQGRQDRGGVHRSSGQDRGGGSQGLTQRHGRQSKRQN